MFKVLVNNMLILFWTVWTRTRNVEGLVGVEILRG